MINGSTSTWSQRASVFLAPAVLLLLFAAARMRRGRAQSAVAGCGGLCTALMSASDNCTAQFALLFAAWLTTPAQHP